MGLCLLKAHRPLVQLPKYLLSFHRIIFESFMGKYKEVSHNRICINECRHSPSPIRNHKFWELQIAKQYFRVLYLDE